MGQFTGTGFGFATPASYGLPQQTYLQPFSSPVTGGNYGFATPGIGTTIAPSQQIAQLLQIVPQQLQQVQQLQQQQIAYLQQLLQWVPAQLQQLQQLIQVVPQHLQQLQQQSQPFGSGISSPLAFGMVPPAFPGQPASHVM